MAAKKTNLPAAAKKKALPVMPGRTPAKPVPGRAAAPRPSGAGAPAWVSKATKKTAPKYTPRKSGGK